ncbi:MAG: exosortase/archaeosortase family protein [Bacteroidota bacterium]
MLEQKSNQTTYRTKIIRLFTDNKTVVFYILKLAIAFILWKLFLWFAGQESIAINNRHWPWFSAHWELFNDWIRIFLLKATSLTLKLFGFSNQIYNDYTVKIDGTCGVSVGNYCIGLQLWFIMAILVLFYPFAKLKVRLTVAAAGIIIINILNILRLTTLNILTVYISPKWLNFNHDFIFNIIVYICIFLLYLWFIRRYGNTIRETDKTTDKDI